MKSRASFSQTSWINRKQDNQAHKLLKDKAECAQKWGVRALAKRHHYTEGHTTPTALAGKHTLGSRVPHELISYPAQAHRTRKQWIPGSNWIPGLHEQPSCKRQDRPLPCAEQKRSRIPPQHPFPKEVPKHTIHSGSSSPNQSSNQGSQQSRKVSTKPVYKFDIEK